MGFDGVRFFDDIHRSKLTAFTKEWMPTGILLHFRVWEAIICYTNHIHAREHVNKNAVFFSENSFLLLLLFVLLVVLSWSRLTALVIRLFVHVITFVHACVGGFIHHISINIPLGEPGDEANETKKSHEIW